jgi:hypothetical protein
MSIESDALVNPYNLFLNKLESKSVSENDVEKLKTHIDNKTITLSKQQIRDLKQRMNIFLDALPSQATAERIREKFSSIFPKKQLKFKEHEVTSRTEYPEEEEIIYPHKATKRTIVPVDTSPQEETAISYDQFLDKVKRNETSWTDWADFEDTLAKTLTKEEWKELQNLVRSKLSNARQRVAFSRLHQQYNPELYKGEPEITEPPPPKEKPLKQVSREKKKQEAPLPKKPSGKMDMSKFKNLFNKKEEEKSE